jgi:hypothetical protein
MKSCYGESICFCIHMFLSLQNSQPSRYGQGHPMRIALQITLILGTVVASTPRVLWAQNTSPPSDHFGELSPTLTARRIAFGSGAEPLGPSADTYKREGAIVGGVAFALTAGLLMALICGDSEEDSDRCGPQIVGGVAVGGAMGYGVGSLIGKAIPKRTE